MNPFDRLVTRIADRLRGPADAAALAAGFEFATLPDGRRAAHLRDMRRIAADHRARVHANPDPLDRIFLTPDLIRHIHTERAASRKAVR